MRTQLSLSLNDARAIAAAHELLDSLITTAPGDPPGRSSSLVSAVSSAARPAKWRSAAGNCRGTVGCRAAC